MYIHTWLIHNPPRPSDVRHVGMVKAVLIHSGTPFLSTQWRQTCENCYDVRRVGIVMTVLLFQHVHNVVHERLYNGDVPEGFVTGCPHQRLRQYPTLTSSHKCLFMSHNGLDRELITRGTHLEYNINQHGRCVLLFETKIMYTLFRKVFQISFESGLGKGSFFYSC
jgi:hypothetical protein